MMPESPDTNTSRLETGFLVFPCIGWVIFLFLAGPAFLNSSWEAALVVFAACTLVPMGLITLQIQPRWWYWVCVVGLAAGYLLTPVYYAAALALPYMLVALYAALAELLNILIFKQFSLSALVRLAVLSYWATGAVWAFCFLGNIHPLDFDAVIVGLTAAHFHVAGFVLGVAAWNMLETSPTRFTRALAVSVLIGMPLVAAGITLTKLGFDPIFEWVAGLGFAGLAWAVTGWQLWAFTQKRFSKSVRRYWLAGAICLLIGAVLAALYALRFQVPMAWITIPNMKIWHGTLNAVGFGWLSLRGWHLMRRPASLSV